MTGPQSQPAGKSSVVLCWSKPRTLGWTETTNSAGIEIWH